MCLDVKIEKLICAANNRAREERENMKDGESCLMWSEGISRPIPRSERCEQEKIARKILATQRQKRTWMGYTGSLRQGAQSE